MRRHASIHLAAAAAAVLLLVPSATSLAATETLDFESKCLDLDAGTVEDCPDLPDDGEAWDVRVSYHADRTPHAVVFQNTDNAVEIAHLEGRSYADVTSEDGAGAPFTTAVVDHAFDGSRVILIRTDTGPVYKLGNVTETDTGVTFDYEPL